MSGRIEKIVVRFDATSETGGAITVASTWPMGQHFRVEWHEW